MAGRLYVDYEMDLSPGTPGVRKANFFRVGVIYSNKSSNWYRARDSSDLTAAGVSSIVSAMSS